MKIKLFISFTWLILICNSCLVEKTKYGLSISKRTNEQLTAEGYSILKHGTFKLKNKFQLTDTLLLSPSKIYQLSAYGGYEWFKFYENGRVLHCDSYYDSYHILISYYQCGYYVLKNNDLKIEISKMATFAFGNSLDILVVKGKVTGDSILFYKDQWGGTGRNIGNYGGRKNEKGEDCFFIKQDKNFITQQPDW